MDEKPDTRQRILDAAGSRFMHYGYQKTTMAEIARDLSMSTGNLYRFFSSKLDIAEAIALKHEDAADAVAQAIVARREPAEARLRLYFTTALDETYKVIAESRKVFEIAQAIIAERPAFANRRLALERVHLSRILQDGIDEGVIASVPDLSFTAEMLQCALMKYRYPQLHGCFDLPGLHRELAGVMDLLFDGLRRRG